MSYAHTHYLANRDKYLDRAKKWYAQNRKLCIERASRRNRTDREARLAVTRRFYQRHKERWAKWRVNNPDKAKANSHVYVWNRLARLRAAQGRFSFEEWLGKIEYHGWRCFYCKRELKLKSIEMDHRKPISRGGSNWLANLVPACRSCNRRKSNGKAPTSLVPKRP
jgi:5-methylcytosine-specific restriction endonuclease McrA